jgi:hypothetical protein
MGVLNSLRIVKNNAVFLSRYGKNALPFIYKSIFNILNPVQSYEDHLKAAISWLCLAQDVCETKGVSTVFSIWKGWDVAYPETTGYIIGSFIHYSTLFKDKSILDRAVKMGEWELQVQQASGGIPSRPGGTELRIFNTGQVILGWLDLYELTEDLRFLVAAQKAGNFLLERQEKNGSWIKDTFCGARTYHSRVAWSLLRLSENANNSKYHEGAFKNLKWVIEQQQKNGWFANCGFNYHNPITHVISYTIEGLLESYFWYLRSGLSTDLDLLLSVQKTLEPLSLAIERYPIKSHKGLLPRSFDNHWESMDRDSCLTGNIQLANVFFQLSQFTKGDNKYLDPAKVLLNATLHTQTLDSSISEIRGGLPGSFPFYKGYQEMSFPNWGTKYLVDALINMIAIDSHRIA